MIGPAPACRAAALERGCGGTKGLPPAYQAEPEKKPAMSAEADFVQSWIAEHIAEQQFAEGNAFGAKRLSLRFAEDARTAGLPMSAIEKEVGDVELLILETLEDRTGK